jgi:hypothetical protein
MGSALIISASERTPLMIREEPARVSKKPLLTAITVSWGLTEAAVLLLMRQLNWSVKFPILHTFTFIKG